MAKAVHDEQSAHLLVLEKGQVGDHDAVIVPIGVLRSGKLPQPMSSQAADVLERVHDRHGDKVSTLAELSGLLALEGSSWVELDVDLSVVVQAIRAAAADGAIKHYRIGGLEGFEVMLLSTHRFHRRDPYDYGMACDNLGHLRDQLRYRMQGMLR